MLLAQGCAGQETMREKFLKKLETVTGFYPYNFLRAVFLKVCK